MYDDLFPAQEWWVQTTPNGEPKEVELTAEPHEEVSQSQSQQHPLAGRVVFYRSSAALQLEFFLPITPPGQIRKTHGFIILTMCPSAGQRNGLPHYDWRNQKIAYKVGLAEASKMLLALNERGKYDGFHVPQPRVTSREEARQIGKTLSMRLAEDGIGYMVTLRHQNRRVTFILDPAEQLQVRLLLQAAIPRMAGWAE